MSLQNLRARTRLRIRELLAELQAVLPRAQREAAQPLELSQLEERVLLSVTPAAVVAEAAEPAPADVAAAEQLEQAAGENETPQEAVTAESLLASATTTDSEIDAAELESGANEKTLVHELVFLQESIADSQPLLDGLASRPDRQIEVVVLAADRGGIDQITEALAGRRELDAVHFVSHGNASGVQLGSTWLSGGSLTDRSLDILQWQDSLTSEADLLFYGCDLASSSEGRQLLNTVQALTGADVAASGDDTGHAALGGDWELEFTAGDVSTGVAFTTETQQQWLGLLETVTFQDGDANGYASTVDGFIEEGDSTNGNLTATEIESETQSGSTDQAFIRFDNLFGNGANQIPEGATITSASLTVYIGNQTNTSATVGLYRILSSWTEANVSYDHFTDGLTADGVEARADADATLPNADIVSSTQTFSGAGLTATLQAWSDDPSSNNGWVILNDHDDKLHLASSEETTQSRRPLLSVTYTTVTLDLDTDDSSGATGSDFAAPYYISGAEVDIADSDTTLSDSDNSDVAQLSLRVSDIADGTDEKLTVGDTTFSLLTATSQSVTFNTHTYSVSVAVESATVGVVTITPTSANADELANVEALLEDITYRNDATTLTSGERTIAIEVTDSDGDSASGMTTLYYSCDENAVAAEEAVGYALPDNAAELYVFNLEDSAVDTASTVALSQQFNGEGMAYRAFNNHVYAFNGMDLYRIDVTDGTVALVKASAVSSLVHGAEFYVDPNTLEETFYVLLANETILTLDPDTGDLVENHFGAGVDTLSLTGGSANSIDSIAVDPTTATVYVGDDRTSGSPGVDSTSDNADIYTVDLSTGALTYVVSTATGVDGESLAFADDGNAYIEEDNGSVGGRSIYRINLSTGALTQVATFPGTGDVEGVAFNAGVSAFAPSLTLDSNNSSGAGSGNFSATFTEGDSPLSIADTDTVFEDENGTTLRWATVTLTNAQAGDSLSVGTIPATLTSNVDTSQSGEITVTFVPVDIVNGASHADFQTAIEAVTFSNSSTSPDETDRVLEVRGFDTDCFVSNVATSTLTVVDVPNTPPTIDLDANDDSGATGTSYQTTFTEDGPGISIVDDDIAITDDSGIITISGITLSGKQTGDSLTIGSLPGGITSSIAENASSISVTLSGSASTSDYETALKAITFSNSSDDPDTTNRAIAIKINDGTVDSAGATGTISVQATNDLPTLDLDASADGTSYSMTYIEGGSAVQIADSDIAIADVDNEPIASATITPSNKKTGDVLNIGSLPTGITASTAEPVNSIQVTLSGSATAADYQTAIRALTFENSQSTPDSTDRVFNIVVNDGTGDSAVATTTVSITENHESLWFSTDADVSGSGAPGLDSWTTGEVISFGGSSFTLESGGTAGTFWSVFDLDSFSQDSTAIDAIHFVRHDVTVGTSTSVSLQSGDVLLSTSFDETVDGTTFREEDVFVFRPASASDYTSGSFFLLIDGSDLSLTDIKGLTLVEHDVQVGDAALTAGSLLYTTGNEDVNLLTLTSAGDTTAGSTSQFLDASDIGISTSTQTVGIELTESAVSIADETIPAGRILLSLDRANGSVGSSSPIATSEQDVFVLEVSTTGATTTATATALFDGSDVNLNVANEDIWGLSFVPSADRNPVVDLDLDDSSSSTGKDFSTTFTEGAGAVTVADSDSVVADVDSPTLSSLTVTLTNRPDGTDESLDATVTGTSISKSYDSGTGILSLTGSDTLASYQQVLRTVSYNNTSDTPDTTNRTISFVASDGSLSSATATTTLAVVSTNDAPTLNLDANDSSAAGGNDYAVTFTEDGSAVAVADSDIAITDSDDANIETAQITLQNRMTGDSLSVGTLPVGITAATALAVDSSSVTITLTGPATPADFQTAIQAVTFSNSSDTPDTTDRTIQIVVSDGEADSAVATTTVTVAATNDAPTLDLDADDSTETGTGFFDSYLEDQTPANIADTDVTITDAEDDDIASATVTLTNKQTGDVLTVGSLPGGITSSSLETVSQIVVTLTGTASRADYQTALQAITYSTVSETPSTTRRLFDIVVNDGSDDSAAARAEVSVASVDDDPILDLDASGAGNDFSTSFTEGSGAVAVTDTDVSVTDTDSANVSGATFTLTNRKDGDVLAAGTLPAGIAVSTSQDSSTFTLTLSGVASKADYETAIESVTFENTSDDPNTEDRTVQVVVQNESGNRDSNTATSTISVTATNDAPSLDLDADDSAASGTAYETTFANGSSAVAIVDSDVSLTDPDDTEVSQVLIVVGGAVDGNDEVLTFNDDAGAFIAFPLATASTQTLQIDGGTTVRVAFDGTSLFTITNDAGGNVPLAVAQELLSDATYENTAATPTVEDGSNVAAQRTFTIGLRDPDSAASSDAVSTITVTNPFDCSPGFYQVLSGQLNLLDPSTGTYTPIGATHDAYNAMGFNQEDGLLYAIGRAGATLNHLVQIHADGSLVDLSEPTPAMGDSGVWNGSFSADFDDSGNLWALDGGSANTVFQIDVSTGEYTTFNLTGTVSGTVTDVAAIEDGGNTLLYGAVTNTSELAIIDPAGGTVTVHSVRGLPAASFGAAWTDNVGHLFVASNSGDGIFLISDYDTGNPFATQVGLSSASSSNDGASCSAASHPFDANLEVTLAQTSASLNGSNIDVAFSATVTNTGTFTLSGLDLINNVSSQLGDAFVSIDNDPVITNTGGATTLPTVNTSWKSDTTLSVFNDDGQLDAGQSFTVAWTVTVDPQAGGAPTTLTNQLEIIADDPLAPDDPSDAADRGASRGVTDLSDDPNNLTDVDTEADGEPDDATTLSSVPFLDLDGNNSRAAGVNFADTFTENGSTVAVADSDLVITDLDDASIEQAVIQLTNKQTGDVLNVSSLPTGITASTSETAGAITVTLSGSASVSSYEAAIRAVSFENPGDDFVTTDRTIEITINDGDSDSATASSTISLIAVNDAPTLDLDGNDNSGATGNDFQTGFVEDGGPVVIVDSDFVLADVDDSQLTGITIVLTNRLDPQSKEALATSTTGTSLTATWDTGSSTLSISGTGSVADYATVLGRVQYDNTSQNPDTTDRVITFQATDGSDPSTTATTTLSFTASNDAPTISAIANQTTDEDVSTGAIAFTVDDAETAAADLTVTATSDDQTLIPDANITLGGSGANRTIEIFPGEHQNGGPATITVTVDDGTTTTQTTFDVTVTAVNDAPTVSAIADQTTDEDVSTGALAFTIGDVETAAADLTVTATSSDQTLIPDANITLGGTGANRTIEILPGEHQNGGPATITLTVNDGSTTTQTTFDVTVTAVNDAPTVSAIADQTTDEDVSTGALAFTIGDVETAAADLTVTATSSDQTLIPDANITLGGTGANRTIEILPGEHQNGGPATITVTVDDGSMTTQTTFDVTVTAVNDPPVISAANSVTLNENTSAVLTATATDIDVPAQPLRFSITGGADATLFDIDLISGDLSFLTAPDFESPSDSGSDNTYEVEISVDDGATGTDSQLVTVDVVDVDEFDVSPISDIDAATNAVGENLPAATVVGIEAEASDGDATDSVMYTLDDDAGGRFTIEETTGVVSTIQSLDAETATSHTISVRATSTDGSLTTEDFTIAVTDADEFDISPISDLDAAANSVAENLAAGTSVGIEAEASDADATDSVMYTLDDDADGRFTIEETTGVVTTTQALDAETATSHTITVRATSTDGSTATENFTIAVEDSDEADISAISDIDATADSVAENFAGGALVGIQANATDADVTDSVMYTLDDDAGGRFTIEETTGVVTTTQSLDAEMATSHTITVRATSTDGSSTTRIFTIAVEDADEADISAISDIDTTANSVAENLAAGASVGIEADASDADVTDTVIYTLDDDAGGRFTIEETTGVLTTTQALDAETSTSHTITVRATSTDGSTTTEDFTIAVTDVDESDISPISDVDADADSISENLLAGATVGIEAEATDADVTDTVMFTLDDDSGGRFTIEETTGVVTTTGPLNAEAATSHTITIRATSTDGSSTTEDFSIAVVDVDEFDVSSISDIDAAANSVSENLAAGAAVGIEAEASDADVTDSVMYTLDDDAGGRFTIEETTGVVTTTQTLDAETATSHTITVRATSTDGSTTTEDFTISVVDADEFDISPVADIDAAANSLNENLPAGTEVGLQAEATDADVTDSVMYTLDDNAGGRFTIEETTGVVTTTGPLDAETVTSHTITIRATSTDGSSSTEDFSIAVVDVDEFDVSSISDLDTAAESVVENSPLTTAAGFTAFASDGDVTDSVLYSLDDDAGGRLTIDEISGVISTSGDIDFEAASQLDIRVRATSTDGSTTTRDVTVNVLDLNDNIPVVTPGQLLSFSEFASNLTVVGSLAATDPDIVGSLQNWEITGGNDLGVFSLDAGSGVLSIADNSTVNFEVTSKYILTVVVEDGDNTSVAESITVNVIDENDLPVLVANTTTTVVEGSSIAITAAELEVTDEDELPPELTYSIAGQPAVGQLELSTDPGTAITSFTQDDIDASRLIYVHDGSESDDSFSFTVSDGSGGMIGQTTHDISVTRVNDAPENSAPIADSTNEDTALVFSTASGNAISIFDDDAFGDDVSVRLSSTNGTLSLAETTGLTFNIGVGAAETQLEFRGTVSAINTALDGLRFDPDENYNGQAVIRIETRDLGNSGGGGEKSDVDSIDVTVISINDAPVSTDDEYNVRQLTTLDVRTVDGLTANDPDVESDPLQVTIVDGPDSGTITLNPDGSFTYTPDGVFFGEDSFTYIVSDGEDISGTATVTITVQQTVPSGTESVPADSETPAGTTPDTDPTDDEGNSSSTPAPGDEPADDGADDSNDDDIPGADPTRLMLPASEPPVDESDSQPDDELTDADIASTVTRIRERSFAEDNPYEGVSAAPQRILVSEIPVMPEGSIIQVLAQTGLWHELDQFEEQLADSTGEAIAVNDLVVGTTTVASTTLSVGYVIWLLRSGSVLVGLVSSLPAWTMMDPLPVLEEALAATGGDDDDSLQALLSQHGTS